MASNYAALALTADVSGKILGSLDVSIASASTSLTHAVVMDAISQLQGVTLKPHSDGQYLDLEGPEGTYTELSLNHLDSDGSIGFRGGHTELIHAVLSHCAGCVGSIVLLDGSGDDLIVFEQDGSSRTIESR